MYCSFCGEEFKKRGRVLAVWRSDSIPEVSQKICSQCAAKIQSIIQKNLCPQSKKAILSEPHLLVVTTIMEDGWPTATTRVLLALPISKLKRARKNSRALRELAANFVY